MSVQEEFETLYHQYFDALAKYVHFKVDRVQDGEDILQEVFLNYYKYIILKHKKVDHPLTYLKRMVDKQVIPLYQLKDLSLDDEIIDFIEDPLNLEQSILDHLSYEEILIEIKKLKIIDQKIILARFRFDLSFKEIAEQLNSNENTVKLRYHRSIQKIQESFDTKVYQRHSW
jgi:RNA polymerase sigma-70 factor (ECF subfamily)